MCGRYTIRRIDKAFLAFGITPPQPEFEEFSERPRFNVAPSQDVAVVRVNRQGDRVLGLVRWGLVPHWTKGTPKTQPINARAETVRTSGMFRQAFERRRCILPADGFYEWQKIGEKQKRPMFVHFADDRVFGFAGVWERWGEGGDTEPLDTCAIITTAPNSLMSPIHDRMPVILHAEDYGRWLDRGTDPAEAAGLLRPYPDGELVATAVSRLVNAPGNDVPECVQPVAEE